MEDVDGAVVAGCDGMSVLQLAKERLDFVTLAIQPLAVMHWFLAAATGRDARRDALPDQHLTDFVPVIPLIPNHHGSRRQSLSNTSAPAKPLHCPSRRWSRRGPPLLWQTPWSLLGHTPLGATNQAGAPPFIEAGRRGIGFETSILDQIKRSL